MDDSELDDLLRSARLTPTIPDSFRGSVWDRIANESMKKSSPFVWLQHLTRPMGAMASIAAMTGMGLWLGSVKGSPTNYERSYVKSISPFSAVHQK
jgi:hypothetical protein